MAFSLSSRSARCAALSSWLLLAGCAQFARPVAPVVPEADAVVAQIELDMAAAQEGVEAIDAPLSLHEALARGLKYNLDRRTKLLEEMIALGQYDVASLDMLPRLVAQSSYAWRSNDRTTRANPTIAEDKEHVLSDLSLSLNALDLGLGYYNTKQAADRTLIAVERRRRATQALLQDIRTAWWRAASAQQLQGELRLALTLGQEALTESRKEENERLRNPVDSLRYQRQVLENMRLLESVDQELSTAQVELAGLINVRPGRTVLLAENPATTVEAALAVPVEVMEEVALIQNADLREQRYNGRIARIETRKTLVRLFPNLQFSYGVKYDTDSYLLHHNWNEVGLQLSFNLFNLLTAPVQMRLADAGVALADQRRVASQMAVLTQVHLARMLLVNARKQFERADAIWDIDSRIAQHMVNRERASTGSKLERISQDTTSILSRLRRYQALSQLQAAQSRMEAAVGLEPRVDPLNTALPDLSRQLREGTNPWQQLVKPAAAPAPKAP